MGPVSLSLDPSLLLARGPGEDSATVVETATGPEVPLGVDSGLTQEVLSDIVVIEGDGAST